LLACEKDFMVTAAELKAGMVIFVEGQIYKVLEVESKAGAAKLPSTRGRVVTYNEPLITSEWAVAVFREVRAAGLVTGPLFPTETVPHRYSNTYGRGWIFTRST
jgi:Elongation factor P (EF-P) KOW-like domain